MNKLNFMLFVILPVLFLTIRCGEEVSVSGEKVVEPGLIDEIEVVQEGGALRINSTGAGNNVGVSERVGLSPDASEVTAGVTYTIVGIPGGNPCAAVQTGGLWRTCCDLQVTNNTGADCHQTLRTVTGSVYLESFLQPGGNDCWLPTAGSELPSARYYHTAVWNRDSFKKAGFQEEILRDR